MKSEVGLTYLFVRQDRQVSVNLPFYLVGGCIAAKSSSLVPLCQAGSLVLSLVSG